MSHRSPPRELKELLRALVDVLQKAVQADSPERAALRSILKGARSQTAHSRMSWQEVEQICAKVLSPPWKQHEKWVELYLAARAYIYESSRFEPDNDYQARLKLAVDELDIE